MKLQNRALRGTLMLGTGLGLFIGAGMAAPADDAQLLETVTVTGYRASLESALSTKRESAAMVDAINSEDVAKFPDANLAESMRRLPGVSIDVDNGEGKTISIRGLGPDFTRVTINGMEALSTAGSANGGSAPNQSRQFDFNTFASELFSSLRVNKSSSAETDEGSLGSTVGLITARPFDMGDKVAFSANNALYPTGHAFNPRIVGLVSHNWFGGRLGTLFSVAYNMRHQNGTSYSSNVGTNFVYAAVGTSGMTFAGTPNPTGTGTIMTRDGFAAPTGTPCSGANGVIPGLAVTNSYYCSALSGSDPSAYNTVETSAYGHMINKSGTWTTSGPTNAIALPQLQQQDLYQSRIGLTSSVQYQVDDRTLISVDGLFSSYYRDIANYYLTDIGVNRNNTVAGLATATSTSSMSSNYSQCTPAAATALRVDTICTFNKATSVYAYYTDPASIGYSASDPNGLKHYIATIGRPTTKLVSAQVTDNFVNTMKLDNVDSRSFVDQARTTTQFEQGTIAIKRDFTDKFRADAMFGMAVSRNTQLGTLIALDTFDRGSASGDGYFSYDASGANFGLQSVDFGFDVANPSSWDFVKGYSDIRLFSYTTVNKYKNIAMNMSYDVASWLTMKFGFAARNYDFSTGRAVRVVNTGYNPSLKELGVSINDVSRIVNYDAAELGLGGKTPTAFVAPDLNKFQQYTHYNCNCVNDYGDFRLSQLNSQGSSNNMTTVFAVTEHDKSYYLQADFQGITLFGNELRGNLGMRYAQTRVQSTGYTVSGYKASAANEYDDLLPAANVVYSLSDDMLVRFAASKVMARPRLGNMAPSITSVSISSTLGASGSLSSGNPYLKPFRSTDVDVSYEWYFGRGSLISVAGFAKYVKNNPQSMSVSGKLSDLLPATMISAIAAGYDPSSIQYQNINDPNIDYTLTMFRDAPGGLLRGIEVNYQQQFNFLPAPFNGFGINANYTFVQSKMHYLYRDVGSTAVSDHIGPWLNSSPNSANATFYYEDDTWSARISGTYRSRSATGIPVRVGAVELGYGTSPAIRGNTYAAGSLSFDMSTSYKLSDDLVARIDASNLTDETTQGLVSYKGSELISGGRSAYGRTITMGVTFKM